MRISDWSSDVCSTDLLTLGRGLAQSEECRPRPRSAGDGLGHPRQAFVGTGLVFETPIVQDFDLMGNAVVFADQGDRKSVVSGKIVSVRVDIGGRRIVTT